MTYEELKKGKKALERKADSCYRQMDMLELKYIEEHQPFSVKRFQRMTVRLRVTQKTRDMLIERCKTMKKYQLDYEYSVTGIFIGFSIGEQGELRPCFYGNTSYNRYDEVLGMELTKEQPTGDCSLCRRYKDGFCYMVGGMELCKDCATHKVEEGDIVCPKYEEKTELWDRYKPYNHYPLVTKLQKEGKTFYRIYSKEWRYYTEYSEHEAMRIYQLERP